MQRLSAQIIPKKIRTIEQSVILNNYLAKSTIDYFQSLQPMDIKEASKIDSLDPQLLLTQLKEKEKNDKKER